MMRHKFGVNGETTKAEQQLPRLSLEQLEALAEALLDFGESRELTRWLENQRA